MEIVDGTDGFFHCRSCWTVGAEFKHPLWAIVRQHVYDAHMPVEAPAYAFEPD